MLTNGYQLNTFEYINLPHYKFGYVLSYLENDGKLRIMHIDKNFYEDGVKINWAFGLDSSIYQHWPMKMA